MAERNPGEALNPSQTAYAQGIQGSGFVVLNSFITVITVGNEQHFMNIPSVSLVPLDSSQNVPLQSLSTDYKNP
jgi:hypothetical protein